MFCKNCGANIPDNVTFCPKCGASTGQTQQTQGNPGGQPYGYQGGYHPQAQRSNAPGKVLLLVVGIILTIFSFVGVVSTAGTMGMLNLMGLGGVAAFELICVSIFCLVLGICAIVFCGKPDKGGIVMILAILAIVFRIIDWIWVGSIYGQFGMSVPAGGIILGIIILALIALGGSMNKKAA
jgi:hypothetical protein